MPDLTQAAVADVYDAQLVRKAELGRAWLAAMACGAPTEGIEKSLLDLQFGTEFAAESVSVDEQQVIISYQQETYGLLAVYTDPLLRAQLPAVPSMGGVAQPYVYGDASGVYGDTSGVYGVGVRIIPNTGPPVFNTTLLPTQTVGAFTFTGQAGDEVQFQMPVDPSMAGPQYVLLFLGGTQVGRLDFPLTAAGNYFRVVHNGVNYLNQFVVLSDPFHLVLLPE